VKSNVRKSVSTRHAAGSNSRSVNRHGFRPYAGIDAQENRPATLARRFFLLLAVFSGVLPVLQFS